MIKSPKMIYILGVVISWAAYIGTASAVMDPVSPKSRNIESSDKSKNISHEKVHEKSNIYLQNKSKKLLNSIITGSAFESEPSTDLDSNSESNSSTVNSNITLLSGKKNEFCENKSYAYSAMHLFAKGFPEDFRQVLEVMSLDDSVRVLDAFKSYFRDLITGDTSFDFIYTNDKFFRLFDLAYIYNKQSDTCNMNESSLCTNHLMQDPAKFIAEILAILGLEKSPLITSQIDTVLWKAQNYELKDHDSDKIGNDIEELAPVQTVSLKKRSSRKVSEFLESIDNRRYSAAQIKDVHLHVDTNKFKYLILKYDIFVDVLDAKNSIAIKKVEKRVRDIINLSEKIDINVHDIKDIGLADKKETLNYKLTPIAAISHKGDALEGGHFITKILAEKTDKEMGEKWIMYDNMCDKDKEVSALKRSELATDYDDYIVVYKVVDSNVIFDF